MVKPPVVQLATMLRALGRPVDTGAWVWLCEEAGQRLFWPPNVSGWDDGRWLDTSRMRARWNMVTYALEEVSVDAWNDDYSTTETPEEALEAVKITVELGNDVNIVDSRGYTPMQGAAIRGAM